MMLCPSLWRTRPRPKESVVRPAEPHVCQRWDSQFLNYDNLHEEKSRVWGQKTHTLQTTYPNPGLLCDTVREKGKSANFLSTSCISLQPGFLLTLSWLSSEHTSLCDLLPDSPPPGEHPPLHARPPQAVQQHVLLGTLTQQTPWITWVKRYPGHDMHLLVQPALLAVSNCQVFVSFYVLYRPDSEAPKRQRGWSLVLFPNLKSPEDVLYTI